MTSPYGNEPERHPSFKINKKAPFNGEPPPSLLKQSFITPNELHFIRNRLPVPDVKARRGAYMTLRFGTIEKLDQSKTSVLPKRVIMVSPPS